MLGDTNISGNGVIPLRASRNFFKCAFLIHPFSLPGIRNCTGQQDLFFMATNLSHLVQADTSRISSICYFYYYYYGGMRLCAFSR